MRQKTKHILILILVAILFITLYILKNLSSYVRILGCGISILLFYFSDSYFELKLLPRHYLIFILISVFGILLSPLYFIFPIYDKMLHLLNPLFYSFLIFFLINKLDIKFYQKVIITLSITISILAIFEIGEFLLDNLFDWKLQGVYL